MVSRSNIYNLIQFKKENETVVYIRIEGGETGLENIWSSVSLNNDLLPFNNLMSL